MLLARVNEGQIATILLDDFIYSGDYSLLFEIEASLSFSGEAVLGQDYFLGYAFTDGGILVSIRGVNDDFLEGIETGLIDIAISVITIVPGKTGRSYQNELGTWVEGSLSTAMTTLQREVEINSAPVGMLEALTYVGEGGTDIVANLAPFVQDGPGEVVSFEPTTFRIQGVRGEVDAAGRLRILAVSPTAPDSVTVDVVVMDDGGARATLQQVIHIARLSLVDEPSSMIIYEGRELDPFNFQLSHAIDDAIQISVVLTPIAGGDEVELFSATLNAGETELSFVPLRALEDKKLEFASAFRLSFKATIGSQDVEIGGLNEAGIPVQIWDKALTPSELPYWADGFEAAHELFSKLFDATGEFLKAAPDPQHAAQAITFISKVSKALNLVGAVVDADKITVAYEKQMMAAEKLLTREARVAASYLAKQELFAEVGLKLGETIFVAAIAEGAAGFAAGFVAGVLGVATAPAWVPVLATVGIGIGVSIIYKNYAVEIKAFFRETFTEALPEETYDEWHDYLSDPTLDDLSLRIDDTGSGPLIATTEAELVLLRSSSSGISGTAGALNGDVVVGITGGDKVLVSGAVFGQSNLAVLKGSAILQIDSDNDGLADTELVLKGDFDGFDFVVLQTAEGTVIVAQAPTAPVILQGDERANKLVGAGGRDSLDGRGGNDDLRGLAGNDQLLGGSGRDWMDGGAGDDALIAGSGADTLKGSGGNDVLSGGAGADRLEGGTGRDILRGGTRDGAADVFVFSSLQDSRNGAGSRDRIVNFASNSDKINLSGIDANSLENGDQAFEFSGRISKAHALWIRDIGSDLVLYGDVNGDGVADFQIQLASINQFLARDLIL